MDGPHVPGCLSSPFKIGIVGLPKVGKTAFFNIVKFYGGPIETSPDGDIQTALVPFCETRFTWLCNLYNPTEKVWPMLQIIDTPGLVRGSFMGEGVGNGFLSQIRSVDAIVHVLRAFEDDNISHVNGKIDPSRDMDTISEELRIKDSEFVTQRLNDIETLRKKSNIKRRICQQLTIEHEFWLKILDHLRAGNDIRAGAWEAKELVILSNCNLLTTKAIIYIVNTNLGDFKIARSKFMPKIRTWVENHGGDIIGWCCVSPETIRMIPAMMKVVFKAANFIFFFSATAKQVKCCLIKEKTNARQAARSMNPNLEKCFSWAEVMRFDDLKSLGSEIAVKDAGRCRKVDSKYLVQDGDVIFF